MYMNAYHKVQGEVRMFEVDARNAIARFPEEWSMTTWPDAASSQDAKEDNQADDANDHARGRGSRNLEDKLSKT